MSNNNTDLTGFEVAIIGISMMAPGAKNVNDFWINLKKGKESIKFFSENELIELGLEKEILENPNYIKAQGVIEDKDYFDSGFFNYLPDEAKILDPQIRKLSECVYAALEDAGCNPYRYEGRIGMYAAASSNLAWEVKSNFLSTTNVNSFAATQLSEKDFISTLISYKLNLKGPSETIDTACSSSLVAINRAYKSILLGECNIAVAGGASLSSQKTKGYLYNENSIYSPDGHCRTFDIEAKGTVGSEGVGVVVLKRLKNALKDKDQIYAVIKGGAVNNDGNRKVGFTAPSIDGQMEVLKLAQRTSKVEPESISFIEAHGTGTVLGDPIEIKALKQVFKKNKYCDIGSVKSNIGHTDKAAGIISFIKVALCLHNKQLVPSLNFNTPNPKCGFEDSSFHVNTTLKEWKNNEYPLRAGVTSLGVGGTNAHVILEETPLMEKQNHKERKYKLIVLSAKTTSSLEAYTGKFIDHLHTNKNLNLSDIAFTLQKGRNSFSNRLMLVGQSQSEIAEGLRTMSKEVKTNKVQNLNRRIVFMFPGQGSQYLNMGLELYETEVFFKQVMDQCMNIAKNYIDYDIHNIIFNQGKDEINNTEYTQPILFIFEYSLAKLLMHWGIEPDCMIGHSIGEYVAACISGVLKLEDAIKIVISRGKLMQELESGLMLSVALSKQELEGLIKGFNLSLAAVNSSKMCVVSGEKEIIKDFEEFLTKKGHECKILHTSHAFHSFMMNPMLSKFKNILNDVIFSKPEIPYYSNVNGNEVSFDEINNSEYWCDQIRNPVQFSDSLNLLLKDKDSIFIEVGPGRTLCSFVNQHENKKSSQKVLNLIKHPKEDISDQYYLFNKIGELWLNGKEPNWENIYEEEDRRKVSLPTYSFEKNKYLAEFDLKKTLSLENKGKTERNDIKDWFYSPGWKKSYTIHEDENNFKGKINLLFADKSGICSSLGKVLKGNSEITIFIDIAETFKQISEYHFTLNPEKTEDFNTLYKTLEAKGLMPDRIIHMWSLYNIENHKLTIDSFKKEQRLGFYSLLYIVNAFNRSNNKLELDVITNNLYKVIDDSEKIIPEKSTIIGVIDTIPNEFNNITTKCIDVCVENEIDNGSIVSQIYQELHISDKNKHVAYRRENRWIRYFEPIEIKEKKQVSNIIKNDRVILITDGLEGIGFELAKYLSGKYNSKLILTGRKPLNKELNIKINKIQGDIIYLQVDVSNANDMKEKLEDAEKRIGTINGIIHCAGIIHTRNKKQIEEVLSSKIYGTIILNDIVKDKELDYFILSSSLASAINPFEHVGYTSANNFQESFAQYRMRNKNYTLSIGWDAWKDVGMTFDTLRKKHPKGFENYLNQAISSNEGCDVLSRALKNNFSNLIISVSDIDILINNQETFKNNETILDHETEANLIIERPEFDIAYLEPTTDIEKELAKIWGNFFGLDKIGIKDDFFELGGDSLKATTLLSLVHEKLDVIIPMTEIFKCPTIKEMSLFIEMVDLDKNNQENAEVINEERERFEI
ncbi:MAG: SDR family NAD(P)-dependent oxidoreductase [Bacteroidales bacterium]|nr:SDR family NAD(P)-dependent oxidoreductase [Bacteroidales bacterium]